MFGSAFNVVLRDLPPEERVDGKTQALSLGFKVSVLKEAPKAEAEGAVSSQRGFTEIPLSDQGILLLIIAWHILSFQIFSRRELAST